MIVKELVEQLETMRRSTLIGVRVSRLDSKAELAMHLRSVHLCEDGVVLGFSGDEGEFMASQLITALSEYDDYACVGLQCMQQGSDVPTFEEVVEIRAYTSMEKDTEYNLPMGTRWSLFDWNPLHSKR